MYKRHFIVILLVFAFSLVFTQEPRIYNLISGDVISGTLVLETDSTVVLKTAFGELTISRDQIRQQRVIISLKSGDVISGFVVKESTDVIILETNLGVLEIPAKNIDSMDFITEKHASGVRKEKVHPATEKWYFSEERLMDLWFDPTGFGLKSGDFYFSALSWAYGLTEKIQFSTQWYGYFFNDFNIRPKITLIQKGNIKTQYSFAIGGHFHSAGLPKKWIKGELHEEDGYFDDNTQKWVPTFRIVNHWIQIGKKEIESNGYWEETTLDNAWGEVFAAFSTSRKRENNQGRINYTIGGSVTYYPDEELMPRIFAGVDIDANRNIKIMAEVIYDPYYVPLYLRVEDTSEKDVQPIHLDIGFMTNLIGLPLLGKSENLWFGIHFQEPFISLYYKF